MSEVKEMVYLIDTRDLVRDLYRTLEQAHLFPMAESDQDHHNFIMHTVRELTRQFLDVFTWELDQFSKRAKDLPNLSYFEHVEQAKAYLSTPYFKQVLAQYYSGLMSLMSEHIGVRLDKLYVFEAITMDHISIRECDAVKDWQHLHI